MPVLYTFANSFMTPEEVRTVYEKALTGYGDAVFHFIPEKFSLDAYAKVLFVTSKYLMKFWRSIGMCVVIVAGQVLIGGMCGMAFAKYPFRGSRVWFLMTVLFLLLPTQVMLLPNYIVLSHMKLTGTWWALILPAVFAPFSVFFMTLIFQGIPTEILEAAKLDGAGTMRIFTDIMIPAAKPGVAALLVLIFVDNWNMVEQPMVFLEKVSEFPLSVFLASVNRENFTLQFVCGIISLIPVTLLFLFFHKELAEGISVSVSK